MRASLQVFVLVALALQCSLAIGGAIEDALEAARHIVEGTSRRALANTGTMHLRHLQIPLEVECSGFSSCFNRESEAAGEQNGVCEFWETFWSLSLKCVKEIGCSTFGCDVDRKGLIRMSRGPAFQRADARLPAPGPLAPLVTFLRP